MRKQVAIACQGGGLNAAFTAGALKRILTEKEPTFDLVGLSGTSAGALCAFITWYGLQTGSAAEAADGLEAIWHDFGALLPAERFFNSWVVGKSLLEGLFRPGPYVVARIPAWTHDPTGAETSFIKRLDKLEFVNLIQGVILGAYDQGNVVIGGRGGQVILADKPDVLHVRIEAPLDIRLNRIQQQQGCSAAEAHALIIERDRAVAKYLGEIFKVRPDEPQLYHLVINLGKWSLDAAAQIIVNAVSLLQAK